MILHKPDGKDALIATGDGKEQFKKMYRFNQNLS